MTKHYSMLALIAGFMGGAVIAPAAFAQDAVDTADEAPAEQAQPAEETDRAQLEEIIITAQKREKRLQDVPMAVSALGREVLESNEVSNIEDLTKLVPSLRVTPADDPTNASLRIRGVGTNVYSIAVEPNVSVVVDEVPLARTAIASFEFADLERVEVMRGPQGTLFGKNSTAGLIHVISRDPADEFEAFARVVHDEPGDFPGNLTNIQAGISGPIADGFGARLTGFYKHVGGHFENVLDGSTLPDRDSFGARGKLMWDGDAVTVRLNVEYQNSVGESSPIIFRSVNPRVEERTPEIEYGEENRSGKSFGANTSDIDNFGASVKVDWDLGDVTLTSVTGYRYFYILRDLDLPAIDGDRIDLTRNGGDREIETWTQEIRLTSNGEGALEYTIGALYFQNSLRNDFERIIENVPASYIAFAGTGQSIFLDVPTLPTALPGESFASYGDSQGKVVTENVGLYGQATWHFMDNWHATGGLRFIYEQLEASRKTHGYLYNETTGVQAQETNFRASGVGIDDTTMIGTASLQYDLGDDTRIYTTVSTGYRGGAFDLAASDAADAFANPVDPETSLSFEIGSKSRFFDNRLELNVAVFRTVFSDFQAQIVDLSNSDELVDLSPLAFKLANAGELETRGIEIDFQARPIAPLFLYGAILYNDAQFNEFDTQCFVGQEADEAGAIDEDGDGTCDHQDVAGGRLPNAPEWSLSLTGRYIIPLNGNGGRLYTQVSGRYVSDIQFSAEQHPGTIQDAYQIWDLRLGWIGLDERIEVAAYVKNLFAQSYAAVIAPFSIDNDRRDIIHGIPRDADRLFGLSVGYQF